MDYEIISLKILLDYFLRSKNYTYKPLVKHNRTAEADEGYFNQIAEGSQKMQMKVGDMLRYLTFSGQKALQEVYSTLLKFDIWIIVYFER